MCGRFAMNSQTNELLEEIVSVHGIGALKDWQQHWPANYNVAPTQQVPVATSRCGQRLIESVRWGMVPPWSKEFGGKPVINARIETVATNGMFKGPFQHHRVVVAAAGYYEWQERDDGKQPYYIHYPGEPLALAGIVCTWHDRALPESDPQHERMSLAIITLDAHITPGEVHDREPAFLTPDAVDDWLGTELDGDDLIDLLRHSSEAVASQLVFREVSRSVNKVQKSKGVPNSGAELIRPIDGTSAAKTESNPDEKNRLW